MKARSQKLKLLWTHQLTHRLKRQLKLQQNRHPPLLKLSLSPRQSRNLHQSQNPSWKQRRSLSLKPLLSRSLKIPLARLNLAGGVASVPSILT